MTSETKRPGQEPARRNEPETVEQPLPSDNAGFWASDAIADTLRALDVPYVSMNPGASYRGLHDSIINRLGNTKPKMLVCLHEESVVAIAHGYAKVTNKAMAAIVHANVGMLHSCMAVFNAFCDRVPILIFGATGPVDAAKRRPWIDWVHTSKDQGGVLRNYTKWDDQPASGAAAQESVLRGWRIAQTAPYGPVYVCLDSGMQETKLDAPLPVPVVARYAPPAPVAPDAALSAKAAAKLHAAQKPVILMGRCSRSEADWAARVQLAEALGAVVLTDMKQPSAFPNEHPLHGAQAGFYLPPEGEALLRDADVVLALNWMDVAGTFKNACKGEAPKAFIIDATLDQHIHNGWSMDYMALPAVDLPIMAEADPTVAALLTALKTLGPRKSPAWAGRQPRQLRTGPTIEGDVITVPQIAVGLQQVLKGRPTTLARIALSWLSDLWPMRGPLDTLGTDGGAGLGSGPGMTIGVALALKDSGRVVLSVLGDGEFIMGATALWTACHYKLPLIIVLANNTSFFNDEVHQEKMAKERGRQQANKWIGMRMNEPDIDFAMLARAQGAHGIGPVRDPAELVPALQAAIKAYDEGKVVVVDVRVQRGYEPAVAKTFLNVAGT